MPARAWTNNSATFDAPKTPILINCRDRVSDLKHLVSWLEEAGQERIYLLDNDSEWEPLLEYYEQTPHTVVRLGRNAGSQSIWRLGRVPDEWFVYTDPDLVPIGECPHDLVSHMHELAERYKVPKVGAGLVIDDLPLDHRVLDWERSLIHEDPGAWAELQRLAALKGKSISDVIRDAIGLEKWFTEETTSGARILIERNGTAREVIPR